MQTKIVKISKNQLIEAQNKSWGGLNLMNVRVNDQENNRFTDCYIKVYYNNRGRVVFEIAHEKGYPSEGRGTVRKEITASWLSNELPKL